MKTIFLFFSTLFFAQNCTKQVASNSLQDEFPIAIQEVYTQGWVAGVRGGGAGTNFYIEFKEKLPKEIVLNQLYFRNKKNPVVQSSDKLYIVAFVSNVNKRENELSSDDNNPVKPDTNVVAPPIPIQENEALLEYSYKGEKRLYKFKDVKEKQMEAYPSVRPRN